jgi:single-strand DNA-binding protein
MNTVCLVGNLTRDPELKMVGSGTPLCNMRIAVNDRRKEGDDWVEVPYYFDVIAWSRLAEQCADSLSKGQKVGVTGKLTWREWEAQDGTKRQSVEISAVSVDFLSPRGEPAGVGSGSSPADDDIPF